VHTKAAERRRLGRELAERCRALANEVDPREAERRAFEEVLARGDVDPQAWPHVYQDFLDAFAPEQRRARGVYYTPAEVVRAQVRLVDDLLCRRLGCPDGFADTRVAIVDPATGSGAYPLAIVDRVGRDAIGRMRLFESLPGAAAVARARGFSVEERDALSVTTPFEAPVVVCIGNPPYRRQTASARARALVDEVTAGTPGVHAKNLYNDYVYFWRWALRAVFEQRPGAGVVCFVTAASYLRGPAFEGLRRSLCDILDELWVVDLEGDHLAARKTDNVFPIRTPVAIALGVRFGDARGKPAALVQYARLSGDRAAKLAALDALRQRWRHFVQLAQTDSARAFGPTRDRDLHSAPPDLLCRETRLKPLAELTADDECLDPVPYAYRSFDRHWVLPDARLGDFMRPALWRVAGPRQVFLTSLLTNVLGPGPAAVATALVPDLDCFRGSFGARAVIPLWRDAAATVPNVDNQWLDRLTARYGFDVTPEALLAYCYALLATCGYVARFAEELRTPGPRIPLARDGVVFQRTVRLGDRALALHTYQQVASGWARCLADPGETYPTAFSYEPREELLQLGTGSFGPIAREVWDYSVSGLRVLPSWLRRRMPRTARSPLDGIGPAAWTPALSRELLELVWLLEATLAIEPALDALLTEIVSGRGESRAEVLGRGESRAGRAVQQAYDGLGP